MENKKIIIIIIATLIIGGLIGWLIKPSGTEVVQTEDAHAHSTADEEWTCSMHPQIRQPEFGACPICGMDLILLDSEDSSGDPASYQMSENAMKLANITTITVGAGDATKEIRLNGKIQVDERNSYSQSTHIPGRIEQLAINFTGEKVRRGQTLAMVYSPQLVTAQEELLQAASIKESQPELFAAAKEKLRNWKIGQSQIDNILKTGKAIQRFPIGADVNGIVTEKLVELGDYVERGMPLYEISDLSKVWVLFDLYESELAWVKEGSKVEYTVNSLPGETFEGTISFIDPLINSQTRVATARVEISNKDGKLKPEMFVSGVVKNNLAKTNTQEIVIPKSSVLWTGKRSVVYLKEDINGKPNFKLREVVLGPALGNSYIVSSGLSEGDEIVSNGTFTVDAAVQLAGKPSMMNPDLGMEEQGSVPTITLKKSEKEQFKMLVSHYLLLKDALVADDLKTSMAEVSNLKKMLNAVNESKLEEPAKKEWKTIKSSLDKTVLQLTKAKNIGELRNDFDELSNTMIQLTRTFKPFGDKLYIQHCPMANNDKGADWLSISQEVKNPYYGSAMLGCGEVTSSIQ
jgi:membrane fusion protein, copper/silver efflux system